MPFPDAADTVAVVDGCAVGTEGILDAPVKELVLDVSKLPGDPSAGDCGMPDDPLRLLLVCVDSARVGVLLLLLWLLDLLRPAGRNAGRTRHRITQQDQRHMHSPW